MHRWVESLVLFSLIGSGAVLGTWYAAVSEVVPVARKIPGLLEAETLRYRVEGEVPELAKQETSTWAGGISENAQLYVGARWRGALVFELPVPEAGRYRVAGYFTRAGDYGVVRVSVNGKEVVPSLDLSIVGFEPTGEIPLGEFAFDRGIAQIEVQSVGKGAHSEPPYYQFGIDGFKLTRIQR